MQINREELIEIITVKTGLDKEQVEEQLNELIAEIREAADKGKNYEIEGFGTFKTVDKKLRFMPAASLKTEINHKYTGMQPIELMGAYKDTPDVAAEGEQKSTTEKEQPEVPADIEQDQEEVFAETENEEKKESSFTFDAAASEEGEELFEEIFETEEEEVAESGDKESLTEPEQQPVMAEEKEEPSSSAGTSKKQKEEADPIGRFLVAAVIIVAIGVSGWFVYDFGLLDPVLGNNDSNNLKQTVQNAGTSGLGKEAEPLAEENADKQESSSEQKKENEVSKSVSIAEQSKSSIYGLRGGAVPEAQAGYTIVVHSLRDKAKAEEIRQNLSAEGFLTILRSARVSGSTYWRVGIGQFKNLEDAKQAINDLPAPYKQNNFIRKF